MVSMLNPRTTACSRVYVVPTPAEPAFGSLNLYDWANPSHDSNETHAWREFALIMMSPWCGFILGFIYGFVRARRPRPLC